MEEITKNSKRGGFRTGAGRPKGTGRYGVPSEPINIPVTLKSNVLSYLEAYEKKQKVNTNLDDSFCTKLEDFFIHFDDEPLSLPLAGAKLDAGFGNMIEDWMEGELEIKEYLVDDKNTSFFKIIGGLSMILSGLTPGTVVIVDRSKDAKSGDIVMAELNGKETVKYLVETEDGKFQLVPHSTEDYPTVTITEYDEFRVVGVINTWFNRRDKKNNPFAKSP